MDKIVITGDSAALDADGLANDKSCAIDTAFVLTATDCGDDLAHKLTFTNNSATDYSGGGKTIAVVGTGPNGEAQSETLVGPAGSVAVTTAKYYLTLTSATPNFAITAPDTFDIGWNAASMSPWTAIDSRVEDFNIGFGCIVVSGTPTYTVQHTYGDASLTAFNHATVASETTSQEGTYTSPVQAIRLSWTAAGEVTFIGRQATRKL